MGRPWSEIEFHYREASVYMSEYSELHTAMAGLAKWIQNSPLSDVLFGGTSMHDLCIIQRDLPTLGNEAFLKISPDFENRVVEFRFVDTAVEERQWNRIETPRSSHLIKRLIGFFRQVGWVNETVELDFDLSRN